MFDFPFSWEESSQLTFIFFRGVGKLFIGKSSCLSSIIKWIMASIAMSNNPASWKQLMIIDEIDNDA